MTTDEKSEISDAEILERLAAGEGIAAIARSQGVTPGAIRERLRQLRERLPAVPPARAPGGEARSPTPLRWVPGEARTLNAVEELQRNFDHLAALRDACLRLLASPDGGLDVGPHDFDLDVVVTSSAGRPVRRPLREFVGADGPRLVAVHAKLADPRPLLLATLAQIRQHLELAVTLSERIYDLRAMQQFEEEVVHAIDAADPALAVQIGERLERRRALGLAPGAPGGAG